MVDDVPLDQSSADGFQVLGEFAFDAGANDQSIRVNDNTGEPNSTNTQLVFDAVRLTRTGLPMPGGDGGNPPPDDPISNGGCSAGGAAAGWPLVLLALGLRRRRRRQSATR